MKKFLALTVLATSAFLTTSAQAEETTASISQTDLSQLQQMACATATSDSSTDVSSEQLKATLATLGLDVSDEQIAAAYSQATELQTQLQSNDTLSQLCRK